MNPNLWSFLTRYRDHTDNYNFTSQMAPYHGKFRIERTALEDWWDTYCNSIYYQPDMPCGISQRPSEYQPLRVDIDLCMPIDGDPGDNTKLEKLYTGNEVKTIVMAYQKVLYEIVNGNKKYENCTAILLEKDHPYVKDGEIKGGFHLHFPKVWLRNCDHDIHVLCRVEKYINENYPDLFRRFNFSKPADAIDKKISNKFWLLYGSCKSVASGTYRATKGFDPKGNEITVLQALEGYKLFNTSEEEIPIDKDNLKKLLPRILSTDPAFLSIHPPPLLPTKIKSGLECFAKQKIVTARERTVQHENINVTDAVDMAKDLMEMLSPSRADCYDSWLEIGWVLYNIGDGCQEALDLWIKFSARTSRGNFDEAKCIWQWNSMLNTARFTVGTLRHYAGIDSPNEYDKWKNEKAKSRISSVLKGGHNDLAKMLKDYYGSVFVYAPVDERSGRWYQFKNHRWHYNIKGLDLREKITEELVVRFQEESKKLYGDMIDEYDEKAIQAKMKVVNKIIGNLKSAPFKNSVMQEAQEVFRKEDFLERLDTNVDLLGFTNGVFDCSKMEFREGKPEDYVSLNVGYDYKDFSEDSPEVQDVQDFLTKVFPDPLLRQFFMEYAGLLIKGGNSRKNFLVMSGEGDNAKSITIELLEHVLCKGKYMIKLPTTLVTGKRAASNAACPELARSHGVRFAVLQEPDKKDVINLGTLKELTGNDSFFARGLFKDGSDLSPQFKLALICNKLPRLSCEDPAAWNRILVLTFEAWFPKDQSKVPKTFEEQLKRKIFPRDAFFNEKLPKMRQAMMWLMIQTFKHISVRGTMEVPTKVTEATATYRRNNDAVLQFMNECIKNDCEEKCSLSLNEVFLAFTQWFKDAFPKLPLWSKNDFEDDFLRKQGPPNNNNRWIGMRLRTIRDEVHEKKAIVLSPNALLKDENESSSSSSSSSSNPTPVTPTPPPTKSPANSWAGDSSEVDDNEETEKKPKKRLLKFKMKVDS